MNVMERNIAVMRGEAMAAHLMASAALEAFLMVIANPLDAMVGINAFMEDTLNRSGPPDRDPRDAELNTQMRETARFQVMQTLQHIEHNLRNRPKKG